MNKNSKIEWCFALVNGRKGEIFFQQQANGKKKIIAHYYLKETDPIIKKMKTTINRETQELRVVYRNKKYRIIKDD